MWAKEEQTVENVLVLRFVHTNQVLYRLPTVKIISFDCTLFEMDYTSSWSRKVLLLITLTPDALN